MTMIVWPHRVNPLVERAGSVKAAATPVAPEETMRIIMAGGGTGGHIYPGLAVAEALRKRNEQEGGRGLEIVWAATPRAVDQRLLSQFGDFYIRQAVLPLMMGKGFNLPAKLWDFWKGWRQTCAFWAAYLDEHEVDCVVALGGYAAGPAAYVAAKRKIPVVLLNPDALPGRANRFLFKRADVVVTQWPIAGLGEGEASNKFAGRIKGEAKPLGCPIREELTHRTREEGAARLGINPALKTLIVTGASLGAKTINDALMFLLDNAGARRAFEAASGANWQIVHLAGVEQAAEVKKAYARFPQVRAKVIDYCEDMGSVWAVADLAIARAGASTCAELTACGVPSMLLPYPFHKDMHQRANAAELANAGAAVVIEDAKDAKLNAAAVKTALQSLLYDEAKRRGMADAARRLGKPRAADAIAGEIVAVVARSSR